MENTENIPELFDLYNRQPLSTITGTPKPTDIYELGFVVITGLGFTYPDPHRHFKFDEFKQRIKNDPKFLEYLKTL